MEGIVSAPCFMVLKHAVYMC